MPYVAVYAAYYLAGGAVHGGTGLAPVYWMLHVVHGAAALVWVRQQSRLPAFGAGLGFWFGVALLIWIPGPYLEFPSDPWEHYARINEWAQINQITAHSAGEKFTYLAAYSLLGWIPSRSAQFAALNLGYTAVCLLLAWQHYRLARAAGLNRGWARCFVLLNLLLAGNNLFSFHRYYGISSSVVAQLGAVALMRLALEHLSGAIFTRRATAQWAAASAGLLLLTAFSHVQGLGIAAFGMIGVFCWRLVEWRRLALLWLIGAGLLLSIAVVWWWPRHPTIDQVYVPARWMTHWYAFHLFSPDSPAWARAGVIVGSFGLLNLLAAVVLLRRNHPAAWLTLVPVVCLCLPMFAVPIAHLLAQRDIVNVITYHRFLFAIPVGLALAAVAQQWCPRREDDAQSVRWLLPPAAAVLLALLTVPSTAPHFNRLWNALAITPADLEGKPTQQRLDQAHAVAGARAPVGGAGLPRFLDAVGPDTPRERAANASMRAELRHLEPIASAEIAANLRALGDLPPGGLFLLPRHTDLTTSGSLAGALSTHWNPHLVALEHAGGPELRAAAEASGGMPDQSGLFVRRLRR